MFASIVFFPLFLLAKNCNLLTIQAIVYLQDEIRKDFKKTGKCNFQKAKEGFIGVSSSFALAKNSPYTKSISQG
jgi:hypothetical protein